MGRRSGALGKGARIKLETPAFGRASGGIAATDEGYGELTPTKNSREK